MLMWMKVVVAGKVDRKKVVKSRSCAEKLAISFTNRERLLSPASLTRLSTKMMLAIQDSLVPDNRALIRFKP